jgi:hypothetical protein
MWPASRLGCFTRREIADGTHWIEGWVSLRVGLDDTEERKISTFQESNPGLPARIPPLW